jgi:DNA repair exonuclease SbcCD ATPase subunit
VTRAVDTALEKFSTTSEEMRKAARDMQRELEQTRGELQRGVLEMPEEAREATAAMRQSIAEQIAAIQELSSIVARHAQAADSLSAPQPAALPARQEARAQARPAQATFAAPRLRQAAPAGASVAREAAVAAEPPRADEADAAPAAEARPRGNGEGRGWVSDLLRRASTAEDQPLPPSPEPAEAPQAGRSPVHMVESLNSLSVDIARAIDHEASVELWERYRRGERNIFTRRLYTLQGQKTFDEIRRKYERDSDFRKAVDNYITDFERLLAQVSQNDRDSMMSQMYLTSDTGKVYTMLAHAAGRLS